MDKQTVVKWLEQKLDDLDIEIPQSIIAEAEEIFEEQIIDAYDKGSENYVYGVDLSGLEYYNKTFINK